MPFAPDSTGGDEEDGSGAGAKQEIASQESDSCKRLGEDARESDGVCGQDGPK